MSSRAEIPWAEPQPPAPDVVAGLQRRTGEAVRRMVDTFTAQIPFYRKLPAEQLRVDVAQVCRDNLSDFVRCCRERRLPASEELTAARAGAQRRAEEGMPLDALVLAYVLGNQVTWQMLAEELTPGRESDVVTFTPYVQRYLQSMLHAVTTAYVEERRAIERDEGSAYRSLVEQLVAGDAPVELAQRLGVVLSEAYLVVAVHFDLTDDEQDPAVDGDVASRRKVRRVQAAVAGAAGGLTTLAALTPRDGLLLLPGIGQRLPGRAETGRVLTTVAAAAGAPVTAVGVPALSTAALPAAAAEARTLLDLARTLGRPAGLYSLQDLVLEHQFSLPGPTRRHLASMLRPLERAPDLLPTARCWLEHERNRREVAQALHVHPNTLDKRLERIAQLTGIDVSTTRGVALLQAALVARDVEDAVGPA